ncbi:cation:proton antiporter [Chryseolinea lacunae]|uniref:Cation:proton antiporter n=1 Tax=Chryseolinea lacunae TaxID=2801331 RepID=A0ABS1KKJ1_9BACT|nr:cation:proton antiporter [Chryseolinea lacunae]MBL0739974.1 cation:proton antiporter [Chryseolinea lacunae]
MLDPGEHLLKGIVGMLLTILLLSWLLKRFRQPYFSAYIIAGILLGPHGLQLFTNVTTIAQIGSLGLIMQMFFIGAEIEVPALMKNIRISAIGVSVQLLLSFIFIAMIGHQLGWATGQIVLFSFIISLSSSAIILEYLHKNTEINSRLGNLATGILILQDFLIVPMIMVLNFLAKGESNIGQLILGVFIALVFVALLRMVVLKRKVLPLSLSTFQPDHELQVFIGLLLCFGFAWMTSLLHLSAAMGAMFAGVIISQNESMKWLDRTLIPFRVFFLSLFFLSIGLQLDWSFVKAHSALISALVILIFGINSLINACVFRLLKESWKNSLYAGALLSQIGEFSLVLCTVAKSLKLVDDFSFQLTLAVVSVSMLLSSGWISVIRSFLFRNVSETLKTTRFFTENSRN